MKNFLTKVKLDIILNTIIFLIPTLFLIIYLWNSWSELISIFRILQLFLIVFIIPVIFTQSKKAFDIVFKKNNNGSVFKLSYEEVYNKIESIQKILPKKSTSKNYQLNPNNKIFSKIKSKNKVENKLQLYADFFCDHLLINRKITIILMELNDVPGKFELLDGMPCIYINKKYNYPNQLLAILVHEITHFYLIYEKKILIENEDENELLTELAACYLGMGFFLLSGYKSVTKRVLNQDITSTIGYISNKVVYKAIISTAYLRKHNPEYIEFQLGKFLYFPTILTKILLKKLHKDYNNFKMVKKS